MSLALVAGAVNRARKDIANGTREEGGNNRGPRVEQMQANAGAHPGDAWCASAVVTWLLESAAELGVKIDWLPRTPSVHRLFERLSKIPNVIASTAPMTGALAFHDAGQGKGHVGIVVDADPLEPGTVEGNTNEAGSREGDGVHEKWRPVSYWNMPFLAIHNVQSELADGERTT